jgi:hypothetical protein
VKPTYVTALTFQLFDGWVHFVSGDGPLRKKNNNKLFKEGSEANNPYCGNNRQNNERMKFMNRQEGAHL